MGLKIKLSQIVLKIAKNNIDNVVFLINNVNEIFVILDYSFTFAKRKKFNCT